MSNKEREHSLTPREGVLTVNALKQSRFIVTRR